MKLNKVLVIYMEGSNVTLNVVKKSLSEANVYYKVKERTKITKKEFRDVDLVIAIGGDGTFLRTSHYIEDKLIMGVNSNPKQKEGFFMGCDKDNFESRLKLILAGKFKIKRLTRLRAWINNKEIDHTLNEVYIGMKRSYDMARYIVQINGWMESQKSSGVLVGTAAGSYAWLRSAGGKVLPLDSSNLQLVVREPYRGKLIKPKLVNKILDKTQTIKIKSLMKRGIVVVDSLSKEYGFSDGDVLTIKVSNKPLKVVCHGR